MIRLQSRVHGDVLLLDAVARVVLDRLGKDSTEPQGILRVECLPDAIARLELAAQEAPAPSAAPGDDDDPGGEPNISLRQRLQPVLELLRHSQREGEPVIWQRG